MGLDAGSEKRFTGNNLLNWKMFVETLPDSYIIGGNHVRIWRERNADIAC